MKKINEKILELLDNGYGLIQMMEHPEVKINKEELIALMKDDEKLNKKLRKRFGDKFFEVAPAEEPENSDPEQPEDNEPEQPEGDSEQSESDPEPENGEPAEEPEQEEPEISEIDALKAEADALGIQYNPTIGAEKLRARIEEFKAKQQ